MAALGLRYFVIFGLFTLASCAHHRGILPDARLVEVRREEPAARCTRISEVEGRAGTTNATRDMVLDDLRRDAANRGGNYVVIKDWSPYGTAVTGVAFACP